MVEKIPVKRVKSSISYAIRNNDGLWATGGTRSTWAKFPKVWGSGAFKNHLHLFCYSSWNATNYFTPEDLIHGFIHKEWRYINCEIVQINEQLEIVATFDAVDWTWDRVYKPHYLKCKYDRDRIEKWAAKHGVMNPLL